MSEINDAAIDRIYDLISKQGEATTAAMQEHGRRMDAQFASQNGVISLLATSVARAEQKLADNSDRIFGAPGVPGVLQHFRDENESREKENKDNAEKIASVEKETSDKIKVVEKEVTTIKMTTIKEKAYIVGFATAASLVIKVALAKIGIHIGN